MLAKHFEEFFIAGNPVEDLLEEDLLKRVLELHSLGLTLSRYSSACESMVWTTGLYLVIMSMAVSIRSPNFIFIKT